MCGRFASARRRLELLEEFGVQRDRVESPLQPDYNVAPTKPVYAVLTRRSHAKDEPGDGQAGDGQAGGGQAGGGQAGGGQAGGGQAAADEPVRQLRVVRWGLVPVWAKDPSIGSRMINARAETVAEKPAFKRAFARRRCLLPADGFYEWQQVEENGKKRKQPYYIYRSDGGVLAFAGLYELWRDPSVPTGSDDGWLWTTTIITTEATDEVGRIHDRMPMIIDRAAWADWLDPGHSDVAVLRRLLAPATSSGLTSHPVSPAVNHVRNNGPELTAVLPESVSGPGQPPADPGRTLF